MRLNLLVYFDSITLYLLTNAKVKLQLEKSKKYVRFNLRKVEVLNGIFHFNTFLYKRKAEMLIGLMKKQCFSNERFHWEIYFSCVYLIWDIQLLKLHIATCKSKTNNHDTQTVVWVFKSRGTYVYIDKYTKCICGII